MWLHLLLNYLILKCASIYTGNISSNSDLFMGVLCFSLNERWIYAFQHFTGWVIYCSQVPLSEMLWVRFYSAAHSRILFFMIGTWSPPLHLAGLAFTTQMYLVNCSAQFCIWSAHTLFLYFYSVFFVFVFYIFWCISSTVHNSAFSLRPNFFSFPSSYAAP